MATTVGGLDTILSHIEAESDKAVKQILSAAESGADKIIKSAERQADDIKQKAKQKADALFSDVIEREKNALEHTESQEILAEKQKLLNKTILNAAKNVKKLDDKKYFDFIEALVKKYITDTEADGVFYMNKNDISRMTENFKKMLADKYPNIKVDSDDTIDSGFIIKYGDIEDNCTINTLVESELEFIKERVNTVLFA